MNAFRLTLYRDCFLRCGLLLILIGLVAIFALPYLELTCPTHKWPPPLTSIALISSGTGLVAISASLGSQHLGRQQLDHATDLSDRSYILEVGRAARDLAFDKKADRGPEEQRFQIAKPVTELFEACGHLIIRREEATQSHKAELRDSLAAFMNAASLPGSVWHGDWRKHFDGSPVLQNVVVVDEYGHFKTKPDGA